MKRLVLILLLLCSNAFASVVDGKFSLNQVFAMPGGGPIQGWNYWRGDPGFLGLNSAACALSVNNCDRLTTGALGGPRDASNFNLGFAPQITSLNAGEYIKFFDNGNGYSYGTFTANGTLINDLGPVSFIKISQSYIVFRVDNWFESIVFTDTTKQLGENVTITVPFGSGINPASWNPISTPIDGGTLVQTNAPANQTITSGGSSSAGPTVPQTTRYNAWNNGIQATDNYLYIEQVSGSYNTVNITQSGVKNTMDLGINGGSNTVNADQTGSNYLNTLVQGNTNTVTSLQTNTSGTHYQETKIMSGNNNTVTVTQKDNGNSLMFNTITGSNNTITAVQEGAGNHYLENKLTGNGNSVLANQSGATSNKANIDLTNAGGPASVDIQQSGGKSFSIIQSCVNPAGCGTVIRQ